jgi:hypothetical protein
MFGHHPVMFGMNMWKRPEQVQQQGMQQLEAGAGALAQQVEVSIFFYNQKLYSERGLHPCTQY